MGNCNCYWRPASVFRLMNNESYLTLPSEVLSAFFGLLVIGTVLGVLYGAEILSGVALTWIVLGGTAVFVPWGCSQARSARHNGAVRRLV